MEPSAAFFTKPDLSDRPLISFQKDSKPRSYLAPREQRRLLFLVLAFGLAVILVLEARKPEHWQWIEGKNGADAEDVFPEAAEGKTLAGKLFPGVDRELLKSVRDNTRFRDQENAAWFNLLGVLKNSSSAELRRAAVGRVSWLQLHEQSKEYRGELIMVKGTVRRAHRVEAAKNDQGIGDYYQLWLQPDDNPKRPIVIYCLQLPTDFPVGMELAERVRVTGFYFKRWLYKGAKDLETAPVLLAKTIGWDEKPTVAENAQRKFSSIYFIVAAAGVCSLFAIGYIVYCTRGRPKKEEALLAGLDSIVEPEEEESPDEEEYNEHENN